MPKFLFGHSQMEGSTTGTEPWFGFDYAAAPLPPALLRGWSEAAPDPALQLPQPNAFIASDFGLVCDAAGAGARAAVAAVAANGSRAGPGANGTAHLQARCSERLSCCSVIRRGNTTIPTASRSDDFVCRLWALEQSVAACVVGRNWHMAEPSTSTASGAS
jgi:Middle or third domain of peptidase_M16